MNREWVISNLKEAIEELQSILESPEEEMEAPSIALAHAYYHLNCACLGAFHEEDPYAVTDRDDGHPFRFFPTDLPEIYGSWFRE